MDTIAVGSCSYMDSLLFSILLGYHHRFAAECIAIPKFARLSIKSATKYLW